MSTFEIEEVELSPVWASGAVNDDWSAHAFEPGGEDGAKALFWSWIGREYGPTAVVVDVADDVHFSHRGDPVRNDGLAGDLVTYTIQVENVDEDGPEEFEAFI